MKLKPFVLSLTLFTIAIFSEFGHAFDELLAKVPPSANSLVLINVEKTLSSPLAIEDGWSKKLELAYVDQPVFLPPEATKLVMAASLQTTEGFQRNWEMAVMNLSSPMGMSSIARSEGGYVDTLRDTEVAWTPSDAYFVSLSDRMLGVMFPADRQAVSRWIAFAKQNVRPMMSTYLREATHKTSDNVQILLAMDLTDVVQPHELNEKVQQSELFEKIKMDNKTAVPLLTSLRGASLRVMVGEKAEAQLRIDFAEDISALERIAGDLVIQVLDEIGVTVPGIEEWQTKVVGTSIRMQGELTQDGQRRIFSLVELPSAKFSLLKDVPPPPSESPGDPSGSGGSQESLIRESSQTYFSSIQVLLKDLKRELRGNKASSAIMERYAGRIDRMPILNVDDDLLDYGSFVSETLRSVALSRRQGGISSGTQTAGMGGSGYSGYQYDYNWFTHTHKEDLYAGARAGAAQRSAIKAQAMAESKNVRVEGSKAIADATAQIRRQMTKKYSVEF